MNQHALAKTLNLSRATVSRALRNDERISAETRRRVRAAADAAGYRQNPYVSVLMAKLRQGGSPLAAPVIAYINPQESRDLWRLSKHWLYTFQGACDRARELGFDLQEFWLREPGMTPERLNIILKTRNIRAVILAPPTPGQSWEFLPENCAAVACDIEPAGEHLSRVSTDYIGNTLKALRTLRELGYRRVGFAMEAKRAGYFQWLPRMAFLEFQESLPQRDRTGYWIGPEAGFRSFARWMERARPDAIVTANWMPQIWLQPLGFRIPEDIAVAQLEPVFAPFQYSGIDGRYEEVGRSAVDLLMAQIRGNEFSLPSHPNHILNAGVWRPGVTAPPTSFTRSGAAYDRARLRILRAAATGNLRRLQRTRQQLTEITGIRPFVLAKGIPAIQWKALALTSAANAGWACPPNTLLRTAAIALPPLQGGYRFHEVPFQIDQNAARTKHSAIAIGGASSPGRLPRIAVDLMVRAIYFFHLAFYAWSGRRAGEYQLHFESGRIESTVLRPFLPPGGDAAGAAFQDSWTAYPQFESATAKPVYLEDQSRVDQGRFAYVLEVRNSEPDDRLVRVDFIAPPGEECVLLVGGISVLLA